MLPRSSACASAGNGWGVSIVFTTDAQIELEQLMLLEDDKGMFPPYNSTLFMRYEIAEQGGAALDEVVAMVNKGLTAEAMQELDARVDLDKKTAEDAPGEHLSETGLVQ
jgi:osmoprotectant transport system substrate-binding protein